MNDQHPKLFISYSWSTSEHENWVMTFATRLREKGVDVKLDKWDLKPGHDVYAFMEKMVTDPEIKKVIMVCDKLYVDKANDRSGGVGKETQIITPEIYERKEQDKFVAVVVAKDNNNKPYLPAYYKTRIHIDMSSDELYDEGFDNVLRWVFDKPLNPRPELGTVPKYITEDNPISLGTNSAFKRAIDAVKYGKNHWQGALNDYFQVFSTNLERFRIEYDGNQSDAFDDKVIESIEMFSPFRDEAVTLILTIAQYIDSPESSQVLYRFFEDIIPYMYKPQNKTSWHNEDFDNYRFIVHELFLYAIASLIKFERFKTVAYLLEQNYFVENIDDSLTSFSSIWQGLYSLDRRNSRLNLRRKSVHADLLSNRAVSQIITFKQLMQVDILLYIRSIIDYMNNRNRLIWYPVTLVYSEMQYKPFEIFIRAKSKKYFEKIKGIMNIENKEELEAIWSPNQKDIMLKHSCRNYINLIGFRELASIP